LRRHRLRRAQPRRATRVALWPCSTSQPVSTSLNGMGSDMIDGSGTINPAALNTAGRASFPSLVLLVYHLLASLGMRKDLKAIRVDSSCRIPLIVLSARLWLTSRLRSQQFTLRHRRSMRKTRARGHQAKPFAGALRRPAARA
jgi:hypothetical protein